MNKLQGNACLSSFLMIAFSFKYLPVSTFTVCGCTSIQNGSTFTCVFKSMQMILLIPLHMNPICLASCSQVQAAPQFINFSTELSLLWLHRSLTGAVLK